MTRKDFKIIADILGAMESASVRDINFAIDKLAIAYPTFDRKKFVKYMTKDKSPVEEKVSKPYVCGGINNQIVLTDNPMGTVNQWRSAWQEGFDRPVPAITVNEDWNNQPF